MTPLLFHGPEARDQAVLRSEKIGRPLSEPLGDNGLKVDDSRLIIELSDNAGIGDRAPSLVIGPLDGATSEASDALLKTLEDLTEAPLRLVLWADHLVGVSPTIRSRTHHVWCPAGRTHISPVAHLREQAQTLCQAILTKEPTRILGGLEEAGKGWPELLQALCLELPNHLEGPHHKTVLEVWERVRKVLDGKGSILVAADALLPREI